MIRYGLVLVCAVFAAGCGGGDGDEVDWRSKAPGAAGGPAYAREPARTEPRDGAATGALPEGGTVPQSAPAGSLSEAAGAAGCELRSFRSTSREHTADRDEPIRYRSDPPTEGKHFHVAAEDGPYERAPAASELVHSLEHGRIVVWFRPALTDGQRASLKAFFDDDSYQMLLVPNETMPYEVAASAWNRDPVPNGTGRLLGCPSYDDDVFGALAAFRDAHRAGGPEPVP